MSPPTVPMYIRLLLAAKEHILPGQLVSSRVVSKIGVSGFLADSMGFY